MNITIRNMNPEFFPTPKSFLEKIEVDFADMWEKLLGIFLYSSLRPVKVI